MTDLGLSQSTWNRDSLSRNGWNSRSRNRFMYVVLYGCLSLAVLSLSSVFQGARTAWAVDGSRIEIQELMIDSEPDIVQRFVPSNYIPLDRKEFDELVEAERKKRIDSILAAPRLSQATYVARLEGRTLISEASTWTFEGTASPQPLSLGPVSIALRDARLEQRSDRLQLSSIIRFQPEGPVEVEINGKTPVTAWFGFISKASEAEEGKSFELRVPVAAEAQLLVSTPFDVELSSDDVIVSQVVAIEQYLPENWPLVDIASPSARKWWRINLSGVSQFRLGYTTNIPKSASLYHCVVREQRSSYVLNEATADLNVEFRGIIAPKTRPAQLQVSAGVHVQSILMNGNPVVWENVGIEPFDERDGVPKERTLRPSLITIPELSTINSDTVLSVVANFKSVPDGSIHLPSIQILDGYVLNGSVVLSTVDSIRVNSMSTPSGWPVRISKEPQLGNSAAGLGVIDRPSDGRVMPSVLANQSDGSSRQQRLSPQWLSTWTGQQPTYSLEVSHQKERWQAETFTALSLQPAWLAAQTTARISSRDIDSNEVRLRIGRGWFVDNVRLLGTSTTGLRIELVESQRERSSGPEVVISWRERRESIDFDIEVSAHQPVTISDNRLRLSGSKVLQLKNGSQIDFYSVEADSRFQLYADAEVLPYQVTARALPTWQIPLLPVSNGAWIFSGASDRIPAVGVMPSEGTFTARMLTFVHVAEGRCYYVIRCTPQSGALDQVRLSVPSGLDLTGTELQYAEVFAAAGFPVAFSILGNGDGTGSNDVEVALPSSTSAPFEIRFALPWECTKKANIYVPALPAAIDVESTLVAPNDGFEFTKLPTVELLESADVWPSGFTIPGMNMTSLSRHTLTSLRIDGNVSQTIEVTRNEQYRAKRWIRSQQVILEASKVGQNRHRVQWEISGGEEKEFRVRIPRGWSFEKLWIENIETKINHSDSQSEIILPLTSGSTIKIEMLFASFNRSSGVFSNVRFAVPATNFRVAESECLLKLPPNLVRVNGPYESTDTALWERFNPRRWWNLFVPNRYLSQPDSGSDDSWQVLPMYLGERLNQSTEIVPVATIRVAEQTPVLAFLLGLLIAASTLAYHTMAGQVRRWWLGFGVVVLLLTVMPTSFVPYLQFLLLAVCIAIFVRLFLRMKEGVGRLGVSSYQLVGRHSQATKTIGMVLLVLGANTGSANAQTPSGSSANVDSDSGIYAVLVPVDKETRTAGSIVYVPQNLWKRLDEQTQTQALSISPAIRKAEYRVVIQSETSATNRSAHEIIFDLLLDVPSLGFELRLPFSSAEVSLVAASLNDVPKLVGGSSIWQTTDAIWYRPIETGTRRLRLRLTPNIDRVLNGKNQLDIAVPPLANAVLTATSDVSVHFDVPSAFNIQRTNNGDLTCHIGPVRRLNVNWSFSPKKSALGSADEVSSETLVYASGSSIMAACQLRIDLNTQVPATVHVSHDVEWEPVGTNWGNVEYVSTDLTSFANRRVTTLRLPPMIGASGSRFIQILLVPRHTPTTEPNAESVPPVTLPVPFLSLQEVAPQSTRRIVAWSKDTSADWLLDGTEFLPQATGLDIDWGELDVGSTRDVYRIPQGLNSLQLRLDSKLDTNSIVEKQAVHFSSVQTRIDYKAVWSSSVSPSVLRLQFPVDASVSKLLVNGQQSPFRIAEFDAFKRLMIDLPEVGFNRIYEVELELTVSTQMKETREVLRVTMLDHVVSKSELELYRSSDISYEVIEEGDFLPLESFSQPLEQIDSLEIPIARYELKPETLPATRIPIKFRLTEKPVAMLDHFVATFQKESDQWYMNVVAEWTSNMDRVDFALFDLPFAARDQLTSANSVRKFLPSSDPQRVTLCLIPETTPIGSKKCTFRFPVASNRSIRALPIPRVYFIADARQMPIVALPNLVDGAVVRWSKAGRMLRQEQLDELAYDPNFHYFEVDPQQLQANWQLVKNPQLNPELFNKIVELVQVEPLRVVGNVEFWMTANGSSAIYVDIPQDCQIIGVESVGKSSVWKVEPDSEKPYRLATIRTRPNFLPTAIRLHVEWKGGDVDKDWKLILPKLRDAPADDRTMVVLHPKLLGIDKDSLAGQSREAVIGSELADRWFAIVASGIKSVLSLDRDEQIVWLRAWSPPNCGLDGAISMTPEQLEKSTELLPVRKLDGETVESAWRLIVLNVLGEYSEEVAESLTPIESRIYQSADLFHVEGDSLSLKRETTIATSSRRYTAALFIALAILLSIKLGSLSERWYLQLVEKNSWIYVAQIAIAAWVLIPIQWPWIAFAAISLYFLLVQVSERGNRRRRVIRV